MADPADPAPPPFPESLCHGCERMRPVRSGRGSTFLRCTEPSLPKYPPQPVRACDALQKKEAVPARSEDGPEER